MTCPVCGSDHHTWRDLSCWGDWDRQVHFVSDPEGHCLPDADRVAYQILRGKWFSRRIDEVAARVLGEALSGRF
jgi:hypothetical protein